VPSGTAADHLAGTAVSVAWPRHATFAVQPDPATERSEPGDEFHEPGAG
jgi:hypothetical protein